MVEERRQQVRMYGRRHTPDMIGEYPFTAWK
jgi:hypothetical protein